MPPFRPLFIDFEASGLSADSRPIEIGLAAVERGDVQVASRLIRPDPAWPMAAWDPISADVHGISLAELARAEPAHAVARWAAERMAGRTVIADAPEWDGRWLRTLLAAAEGLGEPPRVHDFDILVAARLSVARARRVYAALDRLAAPHRAGPDAERLARAWLAGRGTD